MDIIQISKEVLNRLSKMDYERKGGDSEQRLIFPNKFPSEIKAQKISKDELKKYFRISEQELRFLFVEEFLRIPGFYYSIEMPTESKYKLGKTFDTIGVSKDGRSASVDMGIFRKKENQYQRFLNIEFKHQNSSEFSIGKDVLKLMHEKQDGAFIILLKNTSRATLCNKATGVLDKLFKALSQFKEDHWKGKDGKTIQIIIISLEQSRNKTEPFLIHREIIKSDLNNLENVFHIKHRADILTELLGNGWRKY